MQLMDQELSSLISRGTQEGFLTYDEVNAYLPDEDVNPAKLDQLLLAIERHGIQLIEATGGIAASPGVGRAPRARTSPRCETEDSDAADLTSLPTPTICRGPATIRFACT